MVKYIGTRDLQAYLATHPLPQVIGGMLAYLHHDYLRWREFDKTARVASHSAQGVIELMPISDGRLYCFKYVNGHPANTAQGLLTVTAFGVLADVASGYPRLLSELTLTTALRTAATSVLAARQMARSDSRVMAVIGNGAQSEFQILAFHHQMGIEVVRLYDTDPAATARLMRNLRACSGLQLIPCASAAEAVRGADIVTTLTADKRRACIISPAMLEAGMHLNAVGGDCPGKTELHADVLKAARVVVEFAPQSRIEGEVQQMPADFPVTELWQVLAGHAPGRSSAAEVTVFDSVGFALEDFAALRYLDEQVDARFTRQLDLIPAMDDPKDLYGLAVPATLWKEQANA
ncbi:ornithine cyclodeaminase [Herbaspirillum seropedicae]|uniref:Ornithine cyclodeaminase protein n=1 Tax=Herbaspirillum seropedicae (strain SmR1) TaxID=757424 RepID=D8ITV0_HERSS|nr:ornithine cyclodeaminase [Herbaspirillum seropedicae]ADJ61591.1 ornithine cyclodeaminase protein [Herbaspirillum seropedicae SmR1]AKN63809.1 ornithine cyclodeaminase [Herbaspirillum seropedicae]NQE30163.1 ornithine cyclodeaminase [Herbaspirillum seropedicae]UMU19717.1 ornithine cyclodeaminase [Herbaspirillum seropedicae]